MSDAGATGAQALAEAVATAMYERDMAARSMGIAIDEVAPGFARLSMTVRPDMLNGHGVCHGGFVFALADTSFAYACNTGNRVTLASGCSIDFVAPGRSGNRLQAEARLRSAGGRTGVYDIEVSDADGALIALFRGKSYRITGEVIAGYATPEPTSTRGRDHATPSS